MNHLNKHFDQSPEARRKQLQGRISTLEFNLGTAVKHGLPVQMDEVREDLVLMISEFAGGKVDIGEQDRHALFSSRDMTTVLAKTPYLALTDVLIYIPRGMRGTMKDTAIGLLGMAKTMEDVGSLVLAPLVKYTAEITENPALLERPFPLKDNVDLYAVTKDLERLYHSNSETVQAQYGKVITRNRDWVDIAKLNETIQGTLSKERLDDLITKHTRVRELAKLLDNVLQEANADMSASADTVSKYVEYVNYAAGCLSTYGLINSRAIAFNVALADNLERLKKIAD